MKVTIIHFPSIAVPQTLVYLIEQRLHRRVSHSVLGVSEALSEGGRAARLARSHQTVPQLVQVAVGPVRRRRRRGADLLRRRRLALRFPSPVQGE